MTLAGATEKRLVRCAIYTRKSTVDGLDQPVNSLETQREVCRAYIKCQAHRNWVEVPQKYDDGGISGGTLNRPALKRLINDIEANRIDIVVIYKIDRLSRSLTDFVRLMDLLDQYGASFVSVTQTFDTSDSMGRLVLNILLTFAQFERELASERVRDRYAERRRRGLFCGGTPPIGYIVRRGGRLVPDPDRAEADPAWDMMLDLLQAEIAQLRVPVSRLCLAAAVPATTALRWIKTMTEQGLVVRHADPHDGRRVFIELSSETSAALRRYFGQIRIPGAV